MSRRIQIGFKLGETEGIGEQRSWQYCPDRSVTQCLPVHRGFYMATAHWKETKVCCRPPANYQEANFPVSGAELSRSIF